MENFRRTETFEQLERLWVALLFMLLNPRELWQSSGAMMQLSLPCDMQSVVRALGFLFSSELSIALQVVIKKINKNPMVLLTFFFLIPEQVWSEVCKFLPVWNEVPHSTPSEETRRKGLLQEEMGHQNSFPCFSTLRKGTAGWVLNVSRIRRQ